MSDIFSHCQIRPDCRRDGLSTGRSESDHKGSGLTAGFSIQRLPARNLLAQTDTASFLQAEFQIFFFGFLKVRFRVMVQVFGNPKLFPDVLHNAPHAFSGIVNVSHFKTSNGCSQSLSSSIKQQLCRLFAFQPEAQRLSPAY
jgi:hypothetical protein